MTMKRILSITIISVAFLAGAWMIAPQFIGTPSAHSELGKNTPPSFQLAKIQKLIETDTKKTGFFIDPVTGEEIGESWFEALSSSNYEALSLSEKFTYNVIHGESFSQNCNPYELVDAAKNKKIGVEFYFEFSEKGQSFWSERQVRFFHQNRTEVLKLLKKTMREDAHVGENLKAVMVEIEAFELIPTLIKKLEVQPKDYNLLTLLMAIMDRDGYAPLHKTAVYKACLHAKETTYYSSFIPVTKAYEEEIIKTARHYYLEKKK